MAAFLNTQATTWEDLGAALELANGAPSDAFVVLESAPGHFMQCLWEEAGWILEKREGDDSRHFRGGVPHATGAGGAAPTRDPVLAGKLFGDGAALRLRLTFEEVGEAMIAYMRGAEEPEWLAWEPIAV